ncbi:MAG: outer membrane protein transport protein [Candidatus Krumholzibacteria bacterium]|nr:outer membrane protein transport protein [Candidatus Krumholzibacteria bacterium]
MGTKSSALGGTMTASADDPTAIFFNPAGLAGLEGSNFSLDLTGISPKTEFSGVAPNPGFGVTERLADHFFLLPQAYYSRSLGKDLAFGLGFYTPYGLAVEWENPESFSGRSISTFTDLKTYFFSPTLAWKLTDALSLGAGVNLVKGSVHLEQGLVENIPNATDVGTATITGSSDLSYGFNFGLLYDYCENIQLGFNYKSEIQLDFTGEADFTAYPGFEGVLPVDGGAETAIPLPALYSLGISSQLRPDLRFEFNYNRVFWSAFESLNLVFPDSPENNKLLPEDYEDSSQYRFGLAYQYNRCLELRAGFARDFSPQPSASCGPVLPDSDRTVWSLGYGYHFGKNLDLDFYNLMVFADEREVRDNHDGFNGNYRTFSNLLGIGLSYHF